MSGGGVDMEPDISVVVPVYGTAEYLTKCLKSVLDQSFENIEVLCVDDASPDGSGEVLKEMSRRDARIRILTHSQNRGVGAARNWAIRAARGAWIVNVDSDDFIELDMLEALYRGTRGYHFDVVSCGWDRVDATGSVTSSHPQPEVMLDPIPARANPFEITGPSFCAKLWRRRLFIDNDIWFPEHIYYEDASTVPRLIDAAKNINTIPGTYYKYFNRKGSATNSTSDKHMLDYLRYADHLKDAFLSLGEYGVQRENMSERILEDFGFHGGNVSRNIGINPSVKDEYLRYLISIREGYLAMDDVVRQMTTREKAEALNSRRTLGSYPKEEVVRASFPVDRETPLRGVSAEPKVAVLRGVKGASETLRCTASLQAQLYANWELHEVDLEKSRVDSRAMLTGVSQLASRADCILQIQDDVIFGDVRVLGDIVEQFVSRPDADVYSVRVRDGISGDAVARVHMVSTRAVSLNNSLEDFVSGWHFPGEHFIDDRFSADRIMWRMNLTGEEAVGEGIAEGLSLVRMGSGAIAGRPWVVQAFLGRLGRVWDEYVAHRDRRVGLWLYGVLSIAVREPAPAVSASPETWEDLVHWGTQLTDDELYETLQRAWGSRDSREDVARNLLTVTDVARSAVRRLSGIPAKPITVQERARAIWAEVPAGKTFPDLYTAGRKAMLASKFHEGLALMQMALLEEPESRLSYLGVAECLIGLSRLGEARRTYERAARKHPQDKGFTARLKALQEVPTLVRARVPGSLQ